MDVKTTLEVSDVKICQIDVETILEGCEIVRDGCHNDIRRM